MKSAFLMLAVIAGFASVSSVPAVAFPDDEEIVGVINNRTYYYKDLALPQEHQEETAKYYGGEFLDKALRHMAVTMWAEIALVETVREMNPECDLAGTSEEVAEFTGSWLALAQHALDEESGSSDSHRDYPDAAILMNRQRFLLADISTDNEAFSALTELKIEVWKANLCIFKIHGSKRILRFVPSNIVLIPGDTSTTGLPSFSQDVIPIGRNPSVPFGAYVAHFSEARRTGAIALPDVRYEQLFFDYYGKSEPGKFYVLDDSKLVVKPYWHP